MKRLLAIAFIAFLVVVLPHAAHAQTPTATATATFTPTPTPTPAPVATMAGTLCTWERTTVMSNCGQFPDAAGKQLFIAGGISTKGSAQFIQLYDLASAPPSGAPIMVGEAQASPAGNWTFRWSPQAVTLRNGALICNSTNADPTAYTAGAADTTFNVCFR